MKICGGGRPPGGARAGAYWIHTSRAGEARSRHTKAVVPGLVPGTQCPSRLQVPPLKGGAFAAGADAIAASSRHPLTPLGPGDKRREDRKSGVEGTSVAVRVDTGGRRYM